MSKQPAPAIAEMLQELDLSRQILRMIFDSIRSAILLVAPDPRIIFLNKHAQEGSIKTHGRPMTVGESVLTYIRQNGDEAHRQFKSDFEKALRTGEAIVEEREMRFAEQTFWIRTEFTPIFDGDKILGVLLHFHNVTDRKQMQNWNEQQASILSHIAWSQSHETRQPLATLLGLMSILDKTSLTEENREIIALMEQTAQKLEHVIRQNVVRANFGSANQEKDK